MSQGSHRSGPLSPVLGVPASKATSLGYRDPAAEGSPLVATLIPFPGLIQRGLFEAEPTNRQTSVSVKAEKQIKDFLSVDSWCIKCTLHLAELAEQQDCTD
jgi:hypothetical protein